MGTIKEDHFKQCNAYVQTLKDWAENPNIEDENGDVKDGYEGFRPYEDIYDTSYTVSLDGTVRSMRVMLAGGGPSIFFDTATNTVEGYWGSDTVTLAVPEDVGDVLVDFFGLERFEPQH